MPTCELVAQPGYTFTASLRNPYNAYASLASGIAVTEVTPGVYRFSAGSLTGIVYVQLQAGALRVVGFANLSSIGDNGFCEVLDSLADALAVAQLKSIKTKADLITTGRVTIVAPVAANGSIKDGIVIGDDYLAIHNRAFRWTVDKPGSFNLSEATCWFGGKFEGVNKWRIEGDIEDNGDGTLDLIFQLIKADTAELEPANYDWSVAVHDRDGNELTTVRSGTNSVTLYRKFTNAE